MSEDSSDLSEPSQPSEPTESSEPKNADSEDEWMPEAEADSGELRIPQEEQEDDANDYESQEEEEVRQLPASPCKAPLHQSTGLNPI